LTADKQTQETQNQCRLILHYPGKRRSRFEGPFMPAIHLLSLLRRMCKLAGSTTDSDVSDSQLLLRCADQDREALTILVHRYGPLVWRVCQRVLHQADRAEDAFQATFLVLSTRTGSIRKPASLASWLHGVAYRIASRARAEHRRDHIGGKPIEAATTVDPAQEAAWRELGRIVEEEVAELPEKLRLPILLCYWEGQTNEEAARHLGWPCGTVKTRLAQARQRLHGRLLRRGVTLPAGLTAVLLAPSEVKASLPAGLLAATLRGVSEMNSATVAGASTAARLAGVALKGTAPSRWKVSLLLLLALSLTGAGAAAWHVLLNHSPDQNALPSPEPPAITDHQDPVKMAKPGTDRLGDPLPAGVLQRLGTVRFRHQTSVIKVAFAPDGKTLASASLDGTFRLWEVPSGKERLRFKAPFGLYGFPWFGGMFTFSPDGKTLGLACNSLYIWDVAGRKEVQQPLLAPGETDYSFLAIHFSARGKGLVAGRVKERLILWDATTGKELHRFETVGRTNLAVLSPDGKTLAAVAADNKSEESLYLWEVSTGKALRPPEAQPQRVGAAVFSPDGKALALSSNHQVRVLDWARGKELRQWKVGVAGALAFAPDGKTLAAGDNRTIHIWDLATGKETHTFSCFQWIESLAISSDGKTLAVCSGSFFHRLHPLDGEGGGTIHLWDLTTGKRLGPQDAHQDVATCLTFAPDGKTLVSGSRDRTLRFWDPSSGKLLRTVAGHKEEVLAVAFAADGKLLASAGRDKVVRLWNPTSGKEVQTLKHQHDVYGLAFSPKDGTLASTDGNTVRLWEPATAKELRSWTAKGPVYAVAFSPDGKTLAWAGGQRVFLPDGGDNSITLLDLATGKKRQLPGHLGAFAICSLAFSPKGDLLAAGYMNPRLALWQPASGKLLHVIETRAEGTVAFSPNGKTLVSVGPLDSTIYLYESATGKERARFPSPQGAVYAAAFSPDGKTLATAGQDSTILIWSLLAAKH
jgi:RNA polymerase sigma factor (sigma-70 family)